MCPPAPANQLSQTAEHSVLKCIRVQSTQTRAHTNNPGQINCAVFGCSRHVLRSKRWMRICEEDACEANVRRISCGYNFLRHVIYEFVETLSKPSEPYGDLTRISRDEHVSWVACTLCSVSIQFTHTYTHAHTPHRMPPLPLRRTLPNVDIVSAIYRPAMQL